VKAPAPVLERGQVLYRYHDHGPDALGRRHWTRYWITDYRPGHPEQECDPAGRLLRGQCFFGCPAEHVRRDEAAGLTVLEERP